MGSHVMLSVLANSILQMCTQPLVCTYNSVSHVWLGTSSLSMEEHLKPLHVRSLGPAEDILYYYWWNSWFKEGRYQ